MLFNRDTNKGLDTDITEFRDRYHNKHINKYKTKLINKHENKRIDKYKTKSLSKSRLRSKSFTLPQVQPSHHSYAIVTLPQHRLHTAPTAAPHSRNPLSRHPHAASLQPPCRLHTAPTQCCNATPTPSLHRSNAAATQPQRSPHAALTPPSRCLR